MLRSLLLSCVLCISACQPKHAGSTHELSLTFTPHFQGKPIACGQRLSIQNQQWHTSAFAMFLSQFSLNSNSSIILDDNDWQSEQVALIRAAVDCKQASGNMSVVGRIHVGRIHVGSIDSSQETSTSSLRIETLSFTLGVPQHLNHQNPLVQASPLNDSSMFWAWRNGYKFMRWDMKSTNNDSWSFHLGSVGCESAAMVRAPKEACAQPNLIPVTIAVNASAMRVEELSAYETVINLNVAIHLDEIFGMLEPTRPNTCMFSGIDSATCQALVENLRAGKVFQQSTGHDLSKATTQ